jgi:hypothetical protein
MAEESTEELETVEFVPAKEVKAESKLQQGKETAMKNVEQVDYTPTTKYSFVEKTRAVLRQRRDEVKQRLEKEYAAPRKLERFAESAGNASLDTARRVMGARKNAEGEWVKGERGGVSGYVLGRNETFKVAKKEKKGKKGEKKGGRFTRARYIRQQSIQGNPRSHYINPDRRRVGPQSESAYNDNLPQHFGATADWRATTSARLFDVYNLRSPIEATRNQLPRFWEKPVSVGKRAPQSIMSVNLKRGMFKKGVFG